MYIAQPQHRYAMHHNGNTNTYKTILSALSLSTDLGVTSPDKKKMILSPPSEIHPENMKTKPDKKLNFMLLNTDQ